MAGVWRGLVTLVLAVAVVAVGGAAVASAAEAASGVSQTGDAIVLDQRFGLLPEDRGNVSVELAYTVPDDVRSLRTTVPGNATVTGTDGFDRRNETTFEWDGVTDGPTLTYRYDANQTDHRTGPKGAHGSYLGVDVGEWALFTRPETPTHYQFTGERPEFVRRSVVDGEGAAGDWLVYLGPQQTFTRTGADQQFRLVVPEAASMAESPRDVLRSLTAASESLNVGDADEEVFVLAAPTGEVAWAVRGLQTGDADMWVGDDELVTAPENVWYHEYVHTRQSFGTAPGAAWLDEGMAAYYATRATFEHQPMTFAGFADQLAKGADHEYADVVLEDPGTWRGFADYYKGSLAVGRLDRALRLAGTEDGFAAVARTLNDRERVNATAVAGAVEARGGDAVRAELEGLAGTPGNLSMWNESSHREAFGPLPARMSYALAEGTNQSTFEVGGPYRERALEPSDRLALVAGETLTVRAQVSNVGGSEGRYDATLRINGTRVDGASGTVGANETTTVPLEQRFLFAGQYEASVDGTSVVVDVRDPGTAEVTNVSIEPLAVDQGDTATLEVFVRNDGPEPARRNVVVTRNFRPVSRETVYLDAEETQRVRFEVAFPTAGVARVAVNGGQPAEIAVDPAPVATPTATPTATEPPPTPTRTPTPTEETGPGLGLVGAIIALALAAGFARLRAR